MGLFVVALAGCVTQPLNGPRDAMERRDLSKCCQGDFDTPPVLIEGDRPDIWRHASKSTLAKVKFVVTPEGTSDQIKAETTGDWQMAGFAGLAVRDWKFEPARKAGTPVLAQCEMTMDFRLE